MDDVFEIQFGEEDDRGRMKNTLNHGVKRRGKTYETIYQSDFKQK